MQQMTWAILAALGAGDAGSRSIGGGLEAAVEFKFSGSHGDLQEAASGVCGMRWVRVSSAFSGVRAAFIRRA
ncbi:hypothetical protein PWR63_03915 [Paraburkholderia sp. A2WS-5]|uniref:hypothetical protein n=1 Tax=unclassified Paraburkholderia TaxID=2615204 RepID=UPI003B7AAE70